MAQLVNLQDVVGRAFDYVVIGGGTAGLALAVRLSEDPNISILVLEAGEAHLDDPSLTMTGSFGKNFMNPKYDWSFQTVPQKHADDKVDMWFRGKALGGSSTMNFYLLNRPHRGDIDAFEKLGNPGWNWDKLLKYYKRSERFNPPSEQQSVENRASYDMASNGDSGPISAAFPLLSCGWDPLVQDTLGSLGIPCVLDPRNGNPVGTYIATCSINPAKSERSSAKEYLKLAIGRSNLSILVSSHVSRIISSVGTSGKLVATGVEFLCDGQTYEVQANKEVLLCAGSIVSPKVLELSGIGDTAVLSKIGVSTKLDLPGVGNNAQEHIGLGVSYELTEPEKWSTTEALLDPAVVEEQLKLYSEAKGLFTLSPVGVTYVPLGSVSTNTSIHTQHIEKISSELASLSPGLQDQYKIHMEKIERGMPELELVSAPLFFSHPNKPEPQKKYLTFMAMLNYPWSRGTIHAVSTDPTVQPEIDPHYFEQEIDLLLLAELIKFIREKVSKTAPVSGIIGKEYNPGPDVQTDEELHKWIKSSIACIFHCVGTCSMLPLEKGGVVDSTLKVHGTENIRVVDLSVVPLQVASHTQSLAYAIGERGADIIKGLI
ncbi:GMC oxidoreductase [Gloeopeniophorella convolvens]|nr:GMC oxidoreductase [Gloeopeniophorella convolvens]